MLYERTFALAQRPECLAAGNGPHDLEVVPAPFDSDGFFTFARYMSFSMRPSGRMCLFLTKKSFTGCSFIHFTTVGPSTVPVACTARR